MKWTVEEKKDFLNSPHRPDFLLIVAIFINQKYFLLMNILIFLVVYCNPNKHEEDYLNIFLHLFLLQKPLVVVKLNRLTASFLINTSSTAFLPKWVMHNIAENKMAKPDFTGHNFNHQNWLGVVLIYERRILIVMDCIC